MTHRRRASGAEGAGGKGVEGGGREGFWLRGGVGEEEGGGFGRGGGSRAQPAATRWADLEGVQTS